MEITFDELFNYLPPLPEDIDHIEYIYNKFIRKVPRVHPIEVFYEWVTKAKSAVFEQAAARYRTIVENYKKERVRTKALKRGNKYVHGQLWLIPNQLTCPGKTPLCAKCCYANHVRGGAFIQLAAYRLANLAVAERDDFAGIILRDLHRMKRLPVTRIHESGDWYSEEYTLKWKRVIEKMPEHPFQTYTKVVNFFNWMGLIDEDIPNLAVSFSIWIDNTNLVDDVLGLADSYSYCITPVDLAFAYKWGILDDPITLKRDVLDDPDRVSMKAYGSMTYIMKKMLETHEGRKILNEIRAEIVRRFFGEEFLERRDEHGRPLVVWCPKTITKVPETFKCYKSCRFCYEKHTDRIIFFVLH